MFNNANVKGQSSSFIPKSFSSDIIQYNSIKKKKKCNSPSLKTDHIEVIPSLYTYEYMFNDIVVKRKKLLDIKKERTATDWHIVLSAVIHN